MTKITYEQHIKKHTLKENTYNENCPFCNPSSRFNTNSVEDRLKKIAGF